jgi:hypothetical protein
VAGKVQGKEYDEVTGRWVIYNLQEEGELVANMDEVRGSNIQAGLVMPPIAIAIPVLA